MDHHHSSSSSGPGDSSNSRDRDLHYLAHLNKLSHKISKQPISKKPSFENPIDQNFNLRPPVAGPVQGQPPVYNINKSDFRDVVQKLTGSPAHDHRFAAQPAPAGPVRAAQSSRLQRIRPPPLAHVMNRPAASLNCPAAFSPLPALPAVHAAAESPVSAYLRFIENPIHENPKPISGIDQNPKPTSGIDQNPKPITGIDQNHKPFSGIAQFQLPQPPQQQQFQFGCFNSPRSPYPLLSPGPGGLFSPPGGGFPQFPPPSPKVPVSSPRWRDV